MMPRPHLLALLLAAVGLVVDVPLAGALTTLQMSRSLPEASHAPVSLASRLRRLNVAGAPAARRRRADQNERLANAGDVYYTVQVAIGQGQMVDILLDTGSSDTWVRGPNCASADNSCQGPSLNTSDSTVHKTASIFSINYGIGHVSGSVYTTPLTLDGLTVPALNIGVSLIEASLPSQQGILGLGFPPLSDIKRSGAPGVSTMMDAGVNTFGVFLSRAGQDGEITLGGADPKRYKGAATYIPLSAETYWQVAFAGATMSLAGNTSGPNGAGEALAIDLAGGLTDAILDTGTTYVMVTSAVAAAVAKLVDPTSDGFTVSCTTNKDVVLRFGGAAFALPAEGYMVDNGDGTCGTVFVGGAPGIAILGEAFLRYWYTLFDGPGRRIGLAQANHA